MFQFVTAAAALTSKLEKKVGGENSPVPVITWDSRLPFCMLLFILCVCFAPLWHSVNQSESVGALRSLTVLACARARQMRCICRVDEAESREQSEHSESSVLQQNNRWARERLPLWSPFPPPQPASQSPSSKKKSPGTPRSRGSTTQASDGTANLETRRLQSGVFYCEVDRKFHIHL